MTRLLKRLNDYYGDLPRHTKGLNKGRINRDAVSALYGFSIKDLTKAYLNWQDVFRLPDSTLTYKQYLDKLISANIGPSNIGNSKGKYNLSRYGDIGPYTNESCRFILRIDNMKEQKILFGRPNTM